jgi:hypothetical protein
MSAEPDFDAWMTIASATSVVISVIATWASLRSASAARDAVAQAAQNQRVNALREASRLISRVKEGAQRIHELADHLALARTTQFALAGRHVTAAKPLLDRIEDKRSRAATMAEDAPKLGDADMSAWAEEKLADVLRRLDANVTSIESMRESLSADLESVQAELRVRRQATLSKGLAVPPD